MGGRRHAVEDDHQSARLLGNRAPPGVEARPALQAGAEQVLQLDRVGRDQPAAARAVRDARHLRVRQPRGSTPTRARTRARVASGDHQVLECSGAQRSGQRAGGAAHGRRRISRSPTRGRRRAARPPSAVPRARCAWRGSAASRAGGRRLRFCVDGAVCGGTREWPGLAGRDRPTHCESPRHRCAAPRRGCPRRPAPTSCSGRGCRSTGRPAACARCPRPRGGSGRDGAGSRGACRPSGPGCCHGGSGPASRRPASDRGRHAPMAMRRDDPHEQKRRGG